ncbi:hypothetical protein LTR85_006551 [Meristemomyces frigidus]|nr:hypothetical protein LTR85_006551 [Meristemomyces frigidus]
MRSAVIAAAFVAGAIAVPHQKRAVETDTDIVVVYATDIVTVTAGAASSSSVAVAPETTTEASSSATQYGHRWHTWSFSESSSAESSTAEASSAEPTSTYVAPSTSASPTSTYVAPTTSTSASPTSTYVAPTTSSVASSTYVAPSSSSSEEASSTSAASNAVPTTYEEIAVYHHNLHRTNHSAPNVEWDDGLASTAGVIAASCVYAHNVDADGGGYGQNIAAGVEANNISAIITDLFYNGEVGWYDGLYGEEQPDMTNFEHWGHFSQIVWKATTKIGCATQDCTSQGLSNVGSDVAPYFTVCNYESPGNYANEYGDNVGSPLNIGTAQWNTGL